MTEQNGVREEKEKRNLEEIIQKVQISKRNGSLRPGAMPFNVVDIMLQFQVEASVDGFKKQRKGG